MAFKIKALNLKKRVAILTLEQTHLKDLGFSAKKRLAALYYIMSKSKIGVDYELKKEVDISQIQVFRGEFNELLEKANKLVAIKDGEVWEKSPKFKES